ncbi:MULTISPECIES: RHS repeat domain-containing protein [unclassified Morganella (in: enterobacteria)]|uniref:RHS repeat protein n=1 Tax=unclassified Morganella (in: enterobacteria) TaxID=2676694 RepID=UPI002942BF7F|nr:MULTISPECIES: RHS repeat domain-containing protein [unclassified Morganella (in: enterobacteria)]
MNKTENTLHTKTPSVTVLNNRGLAVRDIGYHRHPDTPDKTDERITRHQFDARGFLQQSADPRMQASGLINFHYVTSLSGQVLRTESADAGTSLTLNDAAERPLVSISQIRTDNGKDDRSVAVTHTFQYEGSGSGRPLSIAEQIAGQSAVVSERFVYAGNSEAEKAKNLAGICTHHYDPAGLMQTDSIALTGVPLSVIRQLLKDADNPDIAVNWPESNPQALLSAEKYITQTTADATGAVLNTTDAAGHQQKVTYDIAGLLSTSRVTVKGGAEKIIIKSVDYSAAGQKLREEHGNGVVTTYTYEPQTQRLIAVKTEHPARKNVFQDLRYEYDPVGNVLCVTNDAEETRFWHNQKVVPENRYTYDTLYQLVSATGREMANAGQQSGSLPDISPFDKATYTNYTRNYVYDRAGNMTQIRHSASATNNNYTTDITVSQRSNRAVLKTLADTPEKAEALFTPGGQQTQLQPGQALSWTTRGELRQVMPVVRNGTAGDRESYRYDAGSKRILKAAVQKTGNSTQTQQVIYLPGLELRSGTENYQVICAGVAGRAQVRLLHWPDGKKDHQRFSYDNLIGSSGLETDGDGKLLSQEEYYPFGGTAVLVADTDSGIDYKTHRYSGKERDATGLYYYGYRYYQPWAGRWLSSDPAGTVDGLNLFRMVRNNPVSFSDEQGLVAYPRTQIPGTSLYQPGISTGSDREIRGAKLIPPAANTVTELFKGEPIRLHDVLADSTLQQTPLLTDLINPAKVKMDSSTRSSLSAVKGGIMEFNAVHISAGNNGINALRIIDTETSAFQRGEGTTLAYWVPQGGYADIPAHPENGQPQLVFTPGFSGCSFVADKLDDTTIRVRHVQGGKEDAEYNKLHASEHGHGMIGAMEYRDYGYHENYSGTVLENIQGSAFMKYEGDSWQIKYQRLKNAPGIASMGEITSGIVRKQQGLKLEIRHSRERSVVGTGSVPLTH